MPHISPSLLSSPTFLLIALMAARSTGDAALERLATGHLADLGIRVSFDRQPAVWKDGGR